MNAPMKKRSPEEIERAVESIEAEIEKQKKQHEKEGESFASLTREEIEKKLQRAESPITFFQSWTSAAPPGGTINYSLGIFNPDPVEWNALAVSVAVGNRNAIASNDLFMSDFDQRFPTLAQPPTFGFALAPGASTSLNFALNIPAGVEKTGYFGNATLLQLNTFDVGRYLDRAVFFFGVV